MGDPSLTMAFLQLVTVWTRARSTGRGRTAGAQPLARMATSASRRVMLLQVESAALARVQSSQRSRQAQQAALLSEAPLPNASRERQHCCLKLHSRMLPEKG